jgi:phosphoglucomutase
MHFSTGEKLVVRPSGTEPKIKYYLFVKAEQGGREALEATLPDLVEMFKAAL